MSETKRLTARAKERMFLWGCCTAIVAMVCPTAVLAAYATDGTLDWLITWLGRTSLMLLSVLAMVGAMAVAAWLLTSMVDYIWRHRSRDYRMTVYWLSKLDAKTRGKRSTEQDKARLVAVIKAAVADYRPRAAEAAEEAGG